MSSFAPLCRPLLVRLWLVSVVAREYSNKSTFEHLYCNRILFGIHSKIFEYVFRIHIYRFVNWSRVKNVDNRRFLTIVNHCLYGINRKKKKNPQNRYGRVERLFQDHTGAHVFFFTPYIFNVFGGRMTSSARFPTTGFFSPIFS